MELISLFSNLSLYKKVYDSTKIYPLDENANLLPKIKEFQYQHRQQFVATSSLAKNV
jgi:hypothetical protein